MEGLLLGKERRDVIDARPLLLRAGMAIAISFASCLLFHLRPRLCKARRRLPCSGENEAGRRTAGGLKEALRLIKIEEVAPKAAGGITTSAIVVFSPMSRRSSGDEEGYLLPEFNELVLKEFQLPAKEPETPTTTTSTLKKWDSQETQAMEQEIASLKSKVQSLQESERKLESQLLEYYGLREQETNVRELQNRLKINTVEAKLFSLKIESLQAEKRRLESQVSDYSRVVTELEAAKDKIKLLKRKLRSNKEKVAALHQRFAELQESESKDKECDEELECTLLRLKDLDDENMELQSENLRLVQQNLDLIKELESTKMLESNSSNNFEANKTVLELQQRNEELKKEIEQLQTDRCADAEGMVYLKWVNACLRYELRNYQPPAGKTVARDLSKTLSPKSEEKAKHLILEYANQRNDDTLLMDFDVEYYSCPRASSSLPDDSSASSTKNSSSKTKFFSKLKKLVLGKDANRLSTSSDRGSTSCGSSERHRSVYSYSSDDLVGLGREYPESVATSNEGTVDRTPANSDSKSELLLGQRNGQWKRSSCRTPFGSPKISHPSPDGKSDSSCASRRLFGLGGGGSSVSSPRSTQLNCESMDSPEKAELKKLATALSSNRSSYHRSSESFELY